MRNGSSADCSCRAAVRKDLRYLSFTNLGCINLLLKELPRAVRVSYRGRDSFTNSDDSFSIILPSSTTCTESRGHPWMELAFLMSLSSLLMPAAELLLLQQTTL